MSDASANLADAERRLDRARQLILKAKMAYNEGHIRQTLELTLAALSQVPLQRLARRGEIH
jgi:hypothetical protein